MKNSTRNLALRLLKANNTAFHLTITFSKYTTETTCRNGLNRFLKHLNTTLYKRRYKDGKSFLHGIAIQERSVAMLTYHFHILITDDEWLPSYERLDKLMLRQVNYFRKSTHKNTICDYQLQDYYNEGNDQLEHYLTKQYETCSGERDVELSNIGLLSADDVCFG
jgi:hypothetical protein